MTVGASPSAVFSELSSAVAHLNQLRRGNQKAVFTNGCFDVLHAGHVRYLNEARSLGDLLIVGLNSNESVRKLKGPERPIQDECDRAEILAGLRAVDMVVIFNEETPEILIRALGPDILVKGGDWKPNQIVGSDFVLSRGGEVRSLAFVDGRSTTNIVEKIRRQSSPKIETQCGPRKS